MSKINFIAHAGFAVQDLFRRPSFRVHDVAVDTGESDSFDAMITKCSKDVGIDLSGKDHLRHFERRVVSDATAFDDRLLDTEFVGELAQLFAAAVNDADANADLMQQRQLLRQRDQVFLALCDLTRELDDKRVSLKALNVRQGLAQ